MNCGQPPVKIRYFFWDTLYIDSKKIPLSKLLKALEEYINSIKVASEYRDYIQKLMLEVKKVGGYSTRIRHLGINHEGCRIFLPVKPRPNIVQAPFIFCDITFSPFDTLDIISYVLTNINIDFGDDPRLSFIRSFNPDIEFDIDYIPDPESILDHEKSENSEISVAALSQVDIPFPLHFKVGLLVLACAFVFSISLFPLLNLEYPQWFGAFSSFTCVLIFLTILVYEWLFYIPDYRKILEYAQDKELLIESYFDRVLPGKHHDGWAIHLKVDSSKKLTNKMARSIFSLFGLYGFSWDFFKFDESQIRGVINKKNSILCHKWGYVYPTMCDLGTSKILKSFVGEQAGPYINQVFNKVIASVMEPDYRFTMVQYYVTEYDVHKENGEFKFNKKIPFDDIWSAHLEKEVSLYDRYISIRGFIFPDISKLQPMVVHRFNKLEIKSYPIISKPDKYIENINRNYQGIIQSVI